MTKKEKLRPYLIQCVDRLHKLIELDAPGGIIGAEAFNVFATTLAVYGSSAGSTFIQHVRDQNLHKRGTCSHGDCSNEVQRPDLGLCAGCVRELDLQDCEEVVQ